MRRAFLIINTLMAIGIILQKISFDGAVSHTDLNPPMAQSKSSAPTPSVQQKSVEVGAGTKKQIANCAKPSLERKKTQSIFSRILYQIKRAWVVDRSDESTG